MKKTILAVCLMAVSTYSWAQIDAISVAEAQQKISELQPNPSIRDIVQANSNSEPLLIEFKKVSPLNYKNLLSNQLHNWLETHTNRALGSIIQPQMLKNVTGIGTYQWQEPYGYDWLAEQQSVMKYNAADKEMLFMDLPMENVRLFVRLMPEELTVYFSLKEENLDAITPKLNEYFTESLSEDGNVLSNGTETILLSNCYDGKCSMEYTVKDFMSPAEFKQAFQQTFFTNIDAVATGISFHHDNERLASVTLIVAPKDLEKAQDSIVAHYGPANYANINDGKESWVSSEGAIRTYAIGKNAYVEFTNYADANHSTNHSGLLACYDQNALQSDFEKSLKGYEALSHYACSVPAVEGIEDKQWAGFCQTQQATYTAIKNLGINNIMIGLHESAMDQKQIEQLIQSCSQAK